MADKNNDPMAMWQNMIGEMEKGFNSFASQAMASPEFSKAVHQVSGATADAQKQFGDFLEKYLADANFPSRAQMVEMAARMQSIEQQLGEIKSLLLVLQPDPVALGDGHAAKPRPARPKRSSSGAGEPEQG